jgi:hypothetical protein
MVTPSALTRFGPAEMGARTKRNAALYSRPSYLDLISRLAANTRRLRAEREWTQAEASERCEMATFVYQTVEAGRENFSGTLIARLVDGFGVDVRELLAPAAPLARRAPTPRAPSEPEEPPAG